MAWPQLSSFNSQLNAYASSYTRSLARSRRVSRRVRVGWVVGGAQVHEHLVDGFGDVESLVLEVGVAPCAFEEIVLDDCGDEANVVILECPSLLVWVVHEELGLLSLDGVLRGLRRLGLVGL